MMIRRTGRSTLQKIRLNIFWQPQCWLVIGFVLVHFEVEQKGMSSPIHKEIVVSAEPAKVYDSLLNSEVFSAMTGAPAQIESAAGGEFSCFGGVITGRNIELVPDQTIVQAWRVKFWPEGEYSIVRFDLAPEQQGARVTLEHKGFPDDLRAHLNGEFPEGGWDRQYLDPLQQHFAAAG
jgi:activator of HSP90 ATPase